MPKLHITEAQQERFEALRKELATEHAGSYASVRSGDVVDYLLDLADAVEDPDRTVAPGSAPSSPPFEEASTATDVEPESEDEDEGSAPTLDGGDSGPGGMLNLLETHDDKWREASGDERYEVELDDGTVETARTKDDVKAILFKHY